MPQFDIASFFPQISFFAGIFLVSYVFHTKKVLPKLSRNLKLNKKLERVCAPFATFQLRHINSLSHIYNPSRILSYLIYGEALCVIYPRRFLRTLTLSYVASSN